MNSKVFALILFRRSILRRSPIKSFTLREGRYMWNVQIFISHPREIFTLSEVPSPSSFGILVTFSRGKGSSELIV